MKTAARIIFISGLFILTNSISLKAQLLANTRWKVYEYGSNTVMSTWNFQNDTIAETIDYIFWNWFATYTEVGNVFTIHDIDDVTCSFNTTGVYNFSIVLDTLRFTKITDGCASRSEYLTTHYLVNTPIGINELDETKNVSIFPAPFNSELNIKTDGGSYQFSLYDISGRMTMSKTFDDNTTISTDFFEPGYYLYELKLQDRIIKTGTAIKF